MSMISKKTKRLMGIKSDWKIIDNNGKPVIMKREPTIRLEIITTTWTPGRQGLLFVCDYNINAYVALPNGDTWELNFADSYIPREPLTPTQMTNAITERTLKQVNEYFDRFFNRLMKDLK